MRYQKSRKKAKELGDKYYFSGSTCLRGHVAVRYTTNGTCTECHREHYENNKDEILAQYKEKYWENPEHYRQKTNEYRELNPEKVKESKRREYQNNKERYFAEFANKRALKKQRVPMWAKDNEWHQFALLEAYKLARLRGKLTGITWHVDHIIPLINDKVCGLHVIENLQVITAEENLRKGNRFEVE